MHARVISVQLKPGTAEEVKRIYHDSVLPAARRQPGFQRAMLLVDPLTERVISITQWATEADLAASEESGYLREQVAKLSLYFATPLVSELFSVAVASNGSSAPYPSLPLPSA
jgi:heme-degrading monooxygenase HmoA